MIYTLELAHNGIINLLAYGTTHIYIPNARAGQRVASGTLEHVTAIQREYLKAGYGTRVVEHK